MEKNKCWECNEKHYPRTGKDYKQAKENLDDMGAVQGASGTVKVNKKYGTYNQI